MKKLLDAMLAALARGERAALCSVLASSGSAPRGAGAKMAVFEDGSTRGTIGGGAVEQLCTQRALEAMKSGENELASYELHPNDVSDIGMICGGRVTVYFQLFSPQAAADIAVLRRWREKLDESVDLWLLLVLDGDRVKDFRVLTRGDIPQEQQELFTTHALSFGEHLFCIAMGVLTLPLYQLARTVPADWFVSIGGSKCDDFTVPKETILTGRNSLSKSRLSSVTSGQFVDPKMVRVFTQ